MVLTASRIVELRVAMAVPIQMNAFLSLREAVDWLGLEDAYPEIAAIQRDLYLQAVQIPTG